MWNRTDATPEIAAAETAVETAEKRASNHPHSMAADLALAVAKDKLEELYRAYATRPHRA